MAESLAKEFDIFWMKKWINLVTVLKILELKCFLRKIMWDFQENLKALESEILLVACLSFSDYTLGLTGDKTIFSYNIP